MNSRHLLLPLLFAGGFAVLLPGAARAQRDRDPLADPLPVADNATYAEVDVAQLDLAGPPPPLNAPAPVTAPGDNTGAGSSPSLPATPRDATPTPTPAPGTIRLNFRNASLSDVLNSLSAAAGFIVVQESPVVGTINLNSQQAVTPDEAVDALNSVLADKGFVALRNGRILKIIPRDNAQKRDLPVVVGDSPASIPRKDNMVTQIMPVRYVEVGKLVDTLRPLLSDSATIASNDNANAVILTDTQTNIHRIAEIIHALDSSVSSISVIRVYTLRYADAKELADVVTQLFAPSSSSTNNRNGQQGGFGGFPFFGGRGGRGQGGDGNNANAAPTSEARQAASRVIAVSDETTNSVVVSAPDEYMSAIDDLVAKLDTNTTEVTETQIFKLMHADATEVAASLTALYADTTTANGNANNNNRGNNNNRPGFPGQPNNGAASGALSERALQQARVIAVADPRTNSVLVNASRASISQIALLVGRLDASDSKKQHIYVHRLAHADPTNVAYILNGMFSVSSSSNTFQQPSDTRLQTRSANGLTSDVQSTLGGGTSSSSTGRSSGSGLR